MTTTTETSVNTHVESALPTHARMPEPIPGERPTGGIPFPRLVRVELRKMVDTRAGRWLLIGIGLLVALVLGIMFFTGGGDHPFVEYLQGTAMPVAMLLPVVGILAVTAEWSQRTGLVTFGLEPRRIRVALAKTVASVVVGVAGIIAAFGLAALVHLGAIMVRGATGSWSIDGTVMLGAAGYILIGLLQGVAFAMLLRNTPAAIVAYFALPTVWSILGNLVSWLQTAAEWLDLNRTMQPLFTGSLTGEQWAQLSTSVAVWVVLPLVLGIWRLTRAEVK